MLKKPSSFDYVGTISREDKQGNEIDYKVECTLWIDNTPIHNRTPYDEDIFDCECSIELTDSEKESLQQDCIEMYNDLENQYNDYMYDRLKDMQLENN